MRFTTVLLGTFAAVSSVGATPLGALNRLENDIKDLEQDLHSQAGAESMLSTESSRLNPDTEVRDHVRSSTSTEEFVSKRLEVKGRKMGDFPATEGRHVRLLARALRPALFFSVPHLETDAPPPSATTPQSAFLRPQKTNAAEEHAVVSAQACTFRYAGKCLPLDSRGMCPEMEVISSGNSVQPHSLGRCGTEAGSNMACCVTKLTTDLDEFECGASLGGECADEVGSASDCGNEMLLVGLCKPSEGGSKARMCCRDPAGNSQGPHADEVDAVEAEAEKVFKIGDDAKDSNGKYAVAALEGLKLKNGASTDDNEPKRYSELKKENGAEMESEKPAKKAPFLRHLFEEKVKPFFSRQDKTSTDALLEDTTELFAGRACDDYPHLECKWGKSSCGSRGYHARQCPGDSWCCKPETENAAEEEQSTSGLAQCDNHPDLVCKVGRSSCQHGYHAGECRGDTWCCRGEPAAYEEVDNTEMYAVDRDWTKVPVPEEPATPESAEGAANACLIATLGIRGHCTTASGCPRDRVAGFCRGSTMCCPDRELGVKQHEFRLGARGAIDLDEIEGDAAGSNWLTRAGPFQVEKLDRTNRRTFYNHNRSVTKFLLHTIEGAWPRFGDYEGGTRTLDSIKAWPHFTVAYDRQGNLKICQYAPLNKRSKALKGSSGADGVIQVEVGGKAAYPFTEFDLHLTAAVRHLYRAVQKAMGGAIPNQVDDFVIWTEAGAASSSARQRLTPTQFRAAEGLVSHAVAYGNSHWDPGTIDPRKLL